MNASNDIWHLENFRYRATVSCDGRMGTGTYAKFLKYVLFLPSLPLGML
jgi:hypothetical protein